MLELLTSFGSVPVLALLSLLMAGWLAATAGRRAALAWCIALVLCVGLIAALKVYFRGCPRPEWALRSPSGHAGFSLFAYGGVVLCVLRDEGSWRRAAPAALGVLWIAAIAFSRYFLHAHSVSEILFGLALGGAALLLFARLAGRLPRRRFPFLIAAGVAVLFTALMWRLHWNVNFEQLLGHLGRAWRPWLPLCSRH